jgi:hypothetical protein
MKLIKNSNVGIIFKLAIILQLMYLISSKVYKRSDMQISILFRYAESRFIKYVPRCLKCTRFRHTREINTLLILALSF